MIPVMTQVFNRRKAKWFCDIEKVPLRDRFAVQRMLHMKRDGPKTLLCGPVGTKDRHFLACPVDPACKFEGGGRNTADWFLGDRGHTWDFCTLSEEELTAANIQQSAIPEPTEGDYSNTQVFKE